MLIKWILLILSGMFVLVQHVEPKRVFYFPYAQTSHVMNYMKSAEAVADLGHETFVSMPYSVYTKHFHNRKGRVRILTYAHDIDDIDESYQSITKTFHNFWHEGMSRADIFAFMKGSVWSNNIVRQTLTNTSFVEEISRLDVDFFVLDVIPQTVSLLALPYKLDTPFISMGCHYDYISARIPISFSATPIPLSHHPFTSSMPFTQRLLLTLWHTALFLYDPFSDSELLSLLAPQKPYLSSSDLAARAEMFIFTSDHIIDTPRPALPNTKFIGIQSAQPSKPLSGELKSFMDNSTTGVIYVSFGSQSKEIPSHIYTKLTDVFQRLPFKILWKTDTASPNPEKKILTVQWAPQNDVLGHNNTIAFVSHCGAGSLCETVYHGIPVLCLPLMADQFYLANVVIAKMFGLKADIRDVSAENLLKLIQEVATNDTYRKSIRRASELYRELFKIPVKEGAYWIDHVMKYGGSYMRSVGQEMPLYLFLSLDCFAFIGSVILLMSVLMWKILKRCYRMIKVPREKMKLEKMD